EFDGILGVHLVAGEGLQGDGEIKGARSALGSGSSDHKRLLLHLRLTLWGLGGSRRGGRCGSRLRRVHLRFDLSRRRLTAAEDTRKKKGQTEPIAHHWRSLAPPPRASKRPRQRAR